MFHSHPLARFKPLQRGLLALGFALAAASAHAGLVWDTYTQGVVDASSANRSDSPTRAQLFQVSQPLQVSSFSWSGIYTRFGAAAQEDFVIDIYAGNQGQPNATPIATLQAGGAQRAATAQHLFSDFQVYDYVAVVSQPLVLGAGDYYFSVSSNAKFWNWGVTDRAGNSSAVRAPGDLSWTPGDSAYSLRVNAEPTEDGRLPEPASLALAGTALAALLTVRRRTRG